MSGDSHMELLTRAMLGPALRANRQDPPSMTPEVEIEVSTRAAQQLVGLSDRPAQAYLVKRTSNTQPDPEDERYHIVALRVHEEYLPAFEALVEDCDPSDLALAHRQHERHKEHASDAGYRGDLPQYHPALEASFRNVTYRDMKPFRFVRRVDAKSRGSRKSAN